MAMAMVVNGKVFKVAAGICGLLLTVYALYVYREVTAELQQCGKELSGKIRKKKVMDRARGRANLKANDGIVV